jgi:hypothetical protein
MQRLNRCNGSTHVIAQHNRKISKMSKFYEDKTAVHRRLEQMCVMVADSRDGSIYDGSMQSRGQVKNAGQVQRIGLELDVPDTEYRASPGLTQSALKEFARTPAQ